MLQREEIRRVHLEAFDRKMGLSGRLRLIVERNQNTSRFGRHSLDCSASDNFRQLLVSWHNLLAVPPAGEYPRSSASNSDMNSPSLVLP
jgi:hypothetical protein